MHFTVPKTCLALLTMFALSQVAAAEEVKLISVGGVKGALDLIIADYAKETGNTVKYTVGSPLIVSQKLAAGEVFDVVVQSAPAMNDYAKLGGLKAETRVAVARGGIGMAVRQDAWSGRQPSISLALAAQVELPSTDRQSLRLITS